MAQYKTRQLLLPNYDIFSTPYKITYPLGSQSKIKKIMLGAEKLSP